jgi:hypothetical protein
MGHTFFRGIITKDSKDKVEAFERSVSEISIGIPKQQGSRGGRKNL